MLLCLGTTVVACGFGTAPGPPYDFARLERVVEPVLSLPYLAVVERRESGTDCRGMSCARPRLTYTLRSDPPATFELVQRMLSAFRDVAKPFSRAVLPNERDPTRPHCGTYNGEVMRHAVQVAGEVTSGDDAFGPGVGTANVIRVVVWADRLAVRD